MEILRSSNLGTDIVVYKELQSKMISLLKDWDLNTRYFHYMENNRRKRKRIIRLKDDEGSMIEDEVLIHSLV